MKKSKIERAESFIRNCLLTVLISFSLILWSPFLIILWLMKRVSITEIPKIYENIWNKQ